MRLFRLKLFISVVVLLGRAPSAAANEDPDCNLLPACAVVARAAKRAFEASDFNESLRGYIHGFGLVHDPRLLVNIGRAYFRLGHYQQALEYYERARGLAHDPEIIPQVTSYAAETREAIVRESRLQAASRLLSAPPAAPKVEHKPRRPAWRWALGFATVGAGLALSGIGISGLLLDGQSERGKIYVTRTPGSVMLGGGAALTAAGVLVLTIPSRAGRHEDLQ